MKKRYIYWSTTALVIVAAVFGFYQHSRIKQMKIVIENNYNRAFHELVDYVDDIDSLLEKSMLVSGPAKMAAISSEIFRETSAAKACLGQLPISEVVLENTEKFLSQIGDYTYYLSQNVINNKAVSDNDYKNLTSLSKYANKLNTMLLDMQEDVYSGKISFGTIKKEGEKHFEKVADAAGALSDFEGVEKEFQEYPSLIYDGPFSEHIERIEPIMTGGKEQVAPDTALDIAKKFLGDRGNALAYNGESENNRLPAYYYSVENDEREINIAITKSGGFPLYFTDTRIVYEEKLTVDDAIKKAREFLNQKGYSSLTESYYEKENGTLTVNFAYTQSNITCYSDLLKVKVGLDTGEILGFEAHGYIMNHRYRDFPEIKLTEAEAKAKINSHLNVTSAGLALIPKDSMQEKLCYEFKGTHNGKNFIIYINAENGLEEDIIMLIESENGILAI